MADRQILNQAFASKSGTELLECDEPNRRSSTCKARCVQYNYKMLKTSLILMGVFSVVLNSRASELEEVKTATSETLILFRQTDKPANFHPKKECDRYATLRKGTELIAATNGIRKKEKTGERFLVLSGCLLPFTGTLAPKKGKAMDFYQTAEFESDGEAAFWTGTTTPVPNGKYPLKSGYVLEIKDGHITGGEGGHFCEQGICFEDRD